MDKRIRFLPISVALFLLAACAPAALSQGQVSTRQPTTTSVPATATVTVQHQTPSPTSEGSLLSPFGINELTNELDGSLWVFESHKIGYVKYEFDSDEFERINLHSRCDKHLLYGTTKVVCVVRSSLSLFDLTTKKYEELGIPTPAWISSTQNGKFLFYGYLTEEEEIQIIEVYDLSMREVVSTGAVNVTNWYGQEDSPQGPGGWVSLSPDGKYLSILRYTANYVSKVSLLDMETYTIFDLTPLENSSSNAGGFLWAPTDALLLYADIITHEGDDGGQPDLDLYVYDPKNGSFSFLARPKDIGGTFFTFEVNHLWVPGTTNTVGYSSPFSTDTWSPKSDKVVLMFTSFSVTENEFEQHFGFCVIMISTGDQICEVTDPQSKYYGMSDYAWSSDGRFVAFIARTIEGNDIFIYDTDSRLFYLIAKNTRGVVLYWR